MSSVIVHLDRRDQQAERTIEALRLYEQGCRTLGVLKASMLRRALFAELAKLNEIDFGDDS